MKLTSDQALVADNFDLHKIVLALPGSGKTATSIELAARILTKSQDNRLIMVTFTRASTNETASRVAKTVSVAAMKRCRVDTFAKLMKDHALPLTQGRKVVMGPQHEMLIRRALSEFEKKGRKKAADYLQSRFQADYLANDGAVDGMNTIAQAYIKTIEQARKIDVGTLNVLLVLALRRGDIKPLEATHIIVDEFQDTDSMQYEWILAHREQGTVVTVVGDDDQSIYSWRGSSGYENMLRFQEDFKARGILLKTCFRCRPEILEAAGNLIAFNEQRIDKAMDSSKPPGGKVEYLGITQGDCYESDGFEPEELRENFKQICDFPDAIEKHIGRRRKVLEVAFEEFAQRRSKFGKSAANPQSMQLYLNTHGYIAKRLSQDPNGWAVLARTNRVLDSIQAELAALDVDVIRIGGKSMWDSPNIMGYVSVLAVLGKDTRIDYLDDALFFLEESSDTIHEIHQQLRLNKNLRKVRSDSIESPTKVGFDSIMEQLDKVREIDDSNQAIQDFLGESKLLFSSISKGLSEKMKVFNVVNDIVLSFKGDFSQRIERLLSLARQREKGKDHKANSRIVLCTLNGSKGLQWPKVWLMDVERNVLPIKAQVELSEDAEADRIEEERRLMFVAMTRAEELLRISWSDGKESGFIEEARGF